LPAAVAAARILLPDQLAFVPASGPFLIGEGKNRAGEVEWQVFSTAATPGVCVGYAGPLTLVVGVTKAGVVTGVRVTAHQETPSFVRGIDERWFLEQFTGKTRSDPIQPYVDLDGITHATVTVDALCRGVRFLLNHQAGNHQTGSESPLMVEVGRSSGPSWPMILALAAAVSLAMADVRFPRSGRLVSAILIVLLLGFGTRQFVSLSHVPLILRSLRSGLVPASVALILGAAVVLILCRPRGYCLGLCPMGRLQDILAWRNSRPDGDESLPAAAATRFSDSSSLQISVGRILLWGGLWFSLVVPVPGERLEVFSALFLGNQGRWGWLLVAAAILGSVASSRFYCRALCPLNALFTDVEIVRSLPHALLSGKSDTSGDSHE
jgi:hypothetical protein